MTPTQFAREGIGQHACACKKFLFKKQINDRCFFVSEINIETWRERVGLRGYLVLYTNPATKTRQAGRCHMQRKNRIEYIELEE